MANTVTKLFRTAGVFQITIPDGVNATIDYKIWGAGGAAGGVDGNGPQGNGASGAYTDGTLLARSGDELLIAVGEAGKPGTSGTGSGGGAGGRSFVGH